MPTFQSEGLNISYEQYGSGEPILLIHGFASNGKVNWVSTGWVAYLAEAGYAPITIDNRGHGESEKLYDKAYYPAREMAKDAKNLIHYLGLGPIPIMGYSMGARICGFLAMDHPELVSSVVLGGLGANIFVGLGNSSEIEDALLAPSLAEVKNPVGRTFRKFAEFTKSDLRALAACMGSSRSPLSRQDVAKILAPTLVAIGDLDDVGGAGAPLAEALPNGKLLELEGLDHMKATGDIKFKSGVVEFLSDLPR